MKFAIAAGWYGCTLSDGPFHFVWKRVGLGIVFSGKKGSVISLFKTDALGSLLLICNKVQDLLKISKEKITLHMIFS